MPTAQQTRKVKTANASNASRSKVEDGQVAAQAQTEQAVTAATTKQAVDQQQSIEIMQSMVYSAVSCICFARGLFSFKSFDLDQPFEPSDTHWSYDNFAHGGLPTRFGSQTQGDDEVEDVRFGTTLSLLRRDRDQAAAKFLNLLEKGVFDALRLQYLRSMQLHITHSRDSPTNVLEAYTFNFHYATENGFSALTGFELEGCDCATVTVRNAQHALAMLIRRVIVLVNTLPVLPDQRSYKIHLVYTEDCPDTYEPPGFEPSSVRTIMYPVNEEWARKTSACRPVNAGHHAVQFTASFLQGNKPATSARIPENLTFGTEVSIMQDVPVRAVSQTPSEPMEERPTSRDIAIGGLLTNGIEVGRAVGTPTVPPRDSVQGAANLKLTSSGTLLELNETPSPFQGTRQQDMLMKAQLQGMLQQPSQHDSLEDTQVADPDDPMTPTRSPTATKLELSLATMQGLSLRSPRAATAANIVACQCGSNKQENNMLQCDFCNSLQHSGCYGYSGIDDPRRPAKHICYVCLLGKHEVDLLSKLKEKALARRTLRALETSGFRSEKDLATALATDLQTTSRVVKYLRKEGLLTASTSGRKKGASQNPTLKVQLASDDATLGRIHAAYFDPFELIAHHYEVAAQKAPAPDVPNDAPAAELMRDEGTIRSSVRRSPRKRKADMTDMPPPPSPREFKRLRSSVNSSPSPKVKRRAAI